MSNPNLTSQDAPTVLTQVPFYIQTAISGSPYNANPKSVLSRNGGIVIDNWSPGSAEQMWQFNDDGSISPWQTTSLVLTAQSTSPTSCVQVTLEAFDGSQSLTAAQIWTYQNNHFSVNMGGSIGTVYLNLYNADLAPGTMVITYDYSVGDNEKWFPFPATLTQTASNNFYIQTGLSGSVNGQANPYVLSNNNSGVVIEQLAPGNGTQMWTVNPNGTITPLDNYQVVLTANSSGSGQVTLETFDAATQQPSAAQTWYYGNSQFWVDLGGTAGKVYLNVDDNNLAPGTPVITYEQTTGNNELWYMLPAYPVMAGEWFYLKTEMPNNAGDRNTYVMTVSSTTPGAGTPVVIEPLSPGSPAQLWKMEGNGMLVNALDLSLCLASTPDSHDVTMQSTHGTDYWVQWYLMSNGMLATGPSGENYYLNVQGGGNASSGTNLITYGFSEASNEIWVPLPYEPEGLYFTIQNAAFEQSGPMSNLLSVGPNGVVTLAPPMGGLVIPTGDAAKFQLWRKTMDGYILSATHPNLALTASEGVLTLTIAPLVPGNDKQRWVMGDSQPYSVNGGKDELLVGTIENIYFKELLCNNVLQAPPPPGTAYPYNALWAVVPHGMPFSESTTIRNAGNGETGLFLTMPQTYEKDGTYQITVDAISSDAEVSMWQYEYPGYLVSSVNPAIVLSLEADPTGSAQHPKYLNNAVAYVKVPGTKLFQLWTITNEGLILNQYNGQALTIGAAKEGTNVTTTKVSGTPATSLQVWDFAPGKALQTVLAQPHWSYPVFKDGEQKAYAYICSLLKQKDVRDQYVNLTAPLAGFQSQIGLMLTGFLSGTSLPAGTTAQDFQAVALQLSREFTAVSAVRSLFQQATTLYLSLGQSQSMMLSELITACELTTGINAKVSPPKKKNGWFGSLLEGILYTAMNVAGTFVDDPEAGKQASLFAKFMKNGLPCFANIMSTGYATFQGAQQTASYVAYEAQKIQENFYNYEMTVSQLQQMLLDEFEALGNALGNVETFILADWGKTQAVYEMSNRIGDMSSLFWPSTLTSKDVQKMLSGYTMQVLQTLLPANASYSISATMHTNYQSRQGEGWHNGNYYMENMDGTENIYSTNVNQQVMNKIWACGTKAASFYRRLNGWYLPYSYQDMVATGNETIPAGAGALVTVENFTNVELTLTLTMSSLMGDGSYFDCPFQYTPQTYTIGAYRALQFAGACWIYDGQDHEKTPEALAAPNLGPGITITDPQGNNVMNVEVFNTYQAMGGGNYPAPAILTYKNQDNTAPYNTVISQNIASDGMVLATITVTT